MFEQLLVSPLLVVSLSGIRNATLDHCATFAAELDARGVPLSLLVVPTRPGGRAAVSWVHQRRDRGDAVLMHGYDHTVDPLGPWGSYSVARLGRRAEFAALPAHEAGLRLDAATIRLERLGLGTDAFAPPRWLASPGTRCALRQRGLASCADATAVHDLRRDVEHRGRVLGSGWSAPGHSARAERWGCWGVVTGASRVARRGGLVRIAVDAHDLVRPRLRGALLDAIDAALQHHARPTTYPELTGPARQAGPPVLAA